MVQIKLKPELEQFVEEQVKAGHYPSVDAMVEAALLDMRDAYELDDETIAAINEAEEQADRGEVMTLEECRAHMENWMASRPQSGGRN
jgi:putative addiction module CopG family antidote